MKAWRGRGMAGMTGGYNGLPNVNALRFPWGPGYTLGVVLEGMTMVEGVT